MPKYYNLYPVLTRFTLIGLVVILGSILLTGCNYTQAQQIVRIQQDCSTDYVRTITVGSCTVFIAIDRKGNIVHYQVDEYLDICYKEVLFSLDSVDYSEQSPHFIPVSTNNISTNNAGYVPLERP